MIIPTIGWAGLEDLVEAISMFYLAVIATMSVIRCLVNVKTEVRTRHRVGGKLVRIVSSSASLVFLSFGN
jgi:hypothetical protein